MTSTNGYKYVGRRPHTSPQTQDPYPKRTENWQRTTPVTSRPLDPQSPSESYSGDIGPHVSPPYQSFPSTEYTLRPHVSPPYHSFPSTEYTLGQYPLDEDSERFKSFPLSSDEKKSRTRFTPQSSYDHSWVQSNPVRPLPREHHPEEGRTTGSSYSLPHQSDPGPSGLRESASALPVSKPKADKLPEGIQFSIPKCPSGDMYSHGTEENARYSLDDPPTSDHPNEDRHFAVEGDRYKVFCVFDGHNGPRAAGFASNYLLKLLQQPFWRSLVDKGDVRVVREALEGLFMDTEKQFFASIDKYIQQKKRLQDKIPQHLSSYAAFLQYPNEVQQLQDIEPRLTGGCTAVMAVIIENVLYVANVGDSRAVLVRENSKGVLVTEQLSVDHTVENEDELKRLEALGLSPKNLIKAGRLGTQENTRSIGDYSIKSGYKDVDSIRSATSPPGTARPYVMPPQKIDRSYKYLILMTDGVYKSIESTFEDTRKYDFNQIVFDMIKREMKNTHQFEGLSTSVLKRIAKVNKDAYTTNAKKDVRSPLAVACRKRDDMTLIIHKLN